MFKVLFVCMGNICRSPLAEGIFRKMIENEGLENEILVDSCGISYYHVGEIPQISSTEVAKIRGIDISDQMARQIKNEDFERFDLILCMDFSNLANLKYKSNEEYWPKIKLLGEFSNQEGKEVPDPYGFGIEKYEEVFDLIEECCKGLMEEVRKRI